MSFANGTTHYGLPQTVGTDKRDWFDTNKSFKDIDADLYAAKQTADSAASDITGLGTRVGTVEGDVSSLSTRVGTAEGDISALQSGQTTLSNQIADVKADLSDAICAVKEADATADYAHAVDSYFWYNDTLYITTQAIAVGDTIVPNTNCNTTNVTTEIIKALTQSATEIDDSTTSASKTWSSQKVSGELANKQNASDNSLTTTDKSVVGAINEINSDLSEEHGTITLNENVAGTLSYSKNAHSVTLTFSNTSTNMSQGDTTLATETAIKPNIKVYSNGYAGASATDSCVLSVDTNGVINLYNPQQQAYQNVTITYTI